MNLAIGDIRPDKGRLRSNPMRLLRIERYVFQEWLKVFLLAVVAALVFLLLAGILNDLEDLIEWGATTGEILGYFGVLTPGYLTTVLPVGLLLSILFSLSNLHRNGELIAMRSSGLSLWRITRTLWLAGAFFTGLMFHLNAEVTPWSEERARSLLEGFAYQAELEQDKAPGIGLVRGLTYYNHQERRIYFMNRFRIPTLQAYGLTVHQLDEGDREISRLLANEAYFDDASGHWVLIQGRELRFDPDSGQQVFSRAFARMEEPSLTDDPGLMRLFRKKPQDLSFLELQRVLAALPGETDPRYVDYSMRYWSVLAQPFSCLVVVALAIPFAVTGVRSNPMVGVSKSIGFFFAYYLVFNLAFLIGTWNWIAPLAAAWIPNALALGIGFYLNRRLV